MSFNIFSFFSQKKCNDDSKSLQPSSEPKSSKIDSLRNAAPYIAVGTTAIAGGLKIFETITKAENEVLIDHAENNITQLNHQPNFSSNERVSNRKAISSPPSKLELENFKKTLQIVKMKCIKLSMWNKYITQYLSLNKSFLIFFSTEYKNIDDFLIDQNQNFDYKLYNDILLNSSIEYISENKLLNLNNQVEAINSKLISLMRHKIEEIKDWEIANDRNATQATSVFLEWAFIGISLILFFTTSILYCFIILTILFILLKLFTRDNSRKISDHYELIKREILSDVEM